MIRSLGALALAATLVVPLAVPAAAQPYRDHGRPEYRGGDRHDYHDHGHDGPGAGALVGGALLGLGVGALIGGVLATPQTAYAPPPAVDYAPPPPAYYAPPPPVYYGR